MTAMNMIQAINDAHDVVMARDVRVVAMGEDVGYFGGVFRATEHLQRKYGSARVFDTPISENGIVAAAIGMACYGLRPVARSEEHTSELQSLMRISYAVFCLKKKKKQTLK